MPQTMDPCIGFSRTKGRRCTRLRGAPCEDSSWFFSRDESFLCKPSPSVSWCAPEDQNISISMQRVRLGAMHSSYRVLRSCGPAEAALKVQVEVAPNSELFCRSHATQPAPSPSAPDLWRGNPGRRPPQRCPACKLDSGELCPSIGSW